MTIAPAEPGPTAHMRPPRAVREESQDQLTAALVRARLRVNGTVFKGGFNSHNKYNFVGHLDVITSGAREALLAEGLTLEQTEVSFLGAVTWSKGTGSGASEQAIWRWRGVHVLQHTSGQHRVYSFEASTQPNDKAAFVASTSLDRIAHLRVMELAGSDEENPEHDSHDQAAAKQAQGAQGAQNGAEKAQQKTAAQQQAQQQAQASVKDFLGWLAPLDQPAALIEWAREFNALPVHKNEKKPAWDAFGARCAAVGLDAADIAAAARQAPP